MYTAQPSSLVLFTLLYLCLSSTTFTTFTVQAKTLKDSTFQPVTHAALLRSRTKVHAQTKPQSGAPSSKLGLTALKTHYNPMNRPHKENQTPEKLLVSVKLIKIMEVSDENQELKANVVVTLQWADPRLKGVVPRSDSPQLIDPIQIWTPGFDLSNSAGPAQVLSETVQLLSDGTVQTTRNVLYLASVNVDVHYFPFDIQYMELLFDCPNYDHSQVAFLVNQNNTKLMATVQNGGEEIPGTWALDKWANKVNTRQSIVDGEKHSFLIATAKVQRLYGKACITLVAPLFIIAHFSFLSLLVKTISVRIIMSSTGFFTLGVFFFSINERLPSNSVLTWLHYYCIMTTFFVILLNLLVVIMHGLDPDHAIGALPPNMPLKRTDQDVQLAKEGAARLDHVRLTKEDWGQKRIVMAAGKAFDHVDVHANGQIDSNELLVALTQLCVERVTLKVAHSIIDKYSFAGDDGLDAMSRAEFITYVLDVYTHSEEGDGLKDLLDQNDDDDVFCGEVAETINYWAKVLLPLVYTCITFVMVVCASTLSDRNTLAM